MCGIAGILNTDSEHDHKISIEKMVCALEHRGPDSTKTLSIKRNCYGFTRLSIIDLFSGKQPLEISDCAIVFNGEILTIFREKNQVKEVGTGLECGISIKDFIDFKEKDVIESYLSEEIQRSI